MFVYGRDDHDIYVQCATGGRARLDQLHVQPGWVDRMGVPEDEQPLAPRARNDPRRAGLPDVAPLWQGEQFIKLYFIGWANFKRLLANRLSATSRNEPH